MIRRLRKRMAARYAALKSRDRGFMSVFFALTTIAILMVMGLLVDGGGALNAYNRATSLAQEAARTASTSNSTPRRRSKAPPSRSTRTPP